MAGLGCAEPVIQWQKCFGGNAGDGSYSIQQTSDGGYVFAGFTNSNNGDISGNHGKQDAWVVKLSNTGLVQWQKCLGGTDYESHYSIQQTTDGGHIVAGLTSSNDGNVSGLHDYFNGYWDAWVVRLSDTGSIQWQRCLGGGYNDDIECVRQTSDGGYIVAGQTGSNEGLVSGNHGSPDAWIVKLSSAGLVQWQRCLGGTDIDYACSIQPTSDGGYALLGVTYSNDWDVAGNHGSTDAWVVKLSSNGTIQWQKCLGGSDRDYGKSIQQTFDGGYVIVGRTHSTDGDVSGYRGLGDAWIVKLSSNGTIQWQKCVGGSGGEDGVTIQQTSDRGYVIAGSTNSIDGDVSGGHGAGDSWIVKLTTDGSIQWQKCLGGTSDDIAQSIQQTSDGGYVVAGVTHSINGDVTGNHGDWDAWVVKLGADTPPSESGIIQLYPGWNFISTPRTLADGQDTVGVVFASVDTAGHSTYQYDASTSLWQKMTPSAQVRPLDGIWIYSNGALQVTLLFKNNPQDLYPTKTVYAGWNAIGFSDISPASAKITLQSVNLSPNQWTTAIGYNATSQLYETSVINGGSGSHSDATLMNTAKGYWLNMNGPGTLVALSP